MRAALAARPLPSSAPPPAAGRLRAAAFAAGTVWCAALAHVAAGGGVPGPWHLVAIGALAAGLGALLGWLSAGRLLLAAVMTGGQVFLHELFRFWSAYESGALADHAGHSATATYVGTDVVLPAGGPQLAGPATGPGADPGLGDLLAMPLWHTGCGLLLLLALVHGETLVRRLLAWLLPSLPDARSGIVVPDTGQCPARRPWLPHLRPAGAAHSPRGPPVLIAS